MKIRNIINFIENKNISLNEYKYYAAILGLSPSKGARSPKLWNAAFKGLNFPSFMYPLDVLPENLGNLIKCLREDDTFLGGSIAVPYKTDIIQHLDDIDSEAKAIGAVNCIYRDRNKKLIGTNTDGAGALWSLQSNYGDLNGAKILILGAGGSAAAVAVYIGRAIGNNGKIYISNRTQEKTDQLIQRLSNICSVSSLTWPLSIDKTYEIDIIINCTSIGSDTTIKDQKGFYSLKFYTPIGKIKEDMRVSQLENLEREYVSKASKYMTDNFFETNNFLCQHKKLLIFDIVYQPELTSLLFISNLIGHKILSGSGMNLEQAVIAFDKATSATGERKPNQNEVRKYMVDILKN